MGKAKGLRYSKQNLSKSVRTIKMCRVEESRSFRLFKKRESTEKTNLSEDLCLTRHRRKTFTMFIFNPSEYFSIQKTTVISSTSSQVAFRFSKEILWNVYPRNNLHTLVVHNTVSA